MFCIPCRNLAIAVCLALQAMVPPYMFCTCGQGKEENSRRDLAFVYPEEALGGENSRCSFCEAGAKTQKSYQLFPADRQIRPATVATEKPLPPDNDTIAFGVVPLHNHSLPSPNVHELRVLLE